MTTKEQKKCSGDQPEQSKLDTVKHSPKTVKLKIVHCPKTRQECCGNRNGCTSKAGGAA